MFVLVTHFVSLWIVSFVVISLACVRACVVPGAYTPAPRTPAPHPVWLCAWKTGRNVGWRQPATSWGTLVALRHATPSLSLLRRARCLRWWGLCFVVNTTYTSWDMLYVSGFSDCCMQWRHMRRVRCQRRLRFLRVM